MDVHDAETIGRQHARGFARAESGATPAGSKRPALPARREQPAATTVSRGVTPVGGERRAATARGAGGARFAAPARLERRPATTAAATPAPRERLVLWAAFTRGALVFWLSVFPRVCAHVARWRRRARRIPDPVLRSLALEALAKRSNIEGAAAFAAFAPRRARARAHAVCAASAFQCAYNLLDLLGEQPSEQPVRDGRRLHEALVFALSLDGDSIEPLDWYEFHPQRDDGGFLETVVKECRSSFARLPAADTVAPWAQAAAARIVAFQSLNLSEAQGDHSGLERWGTEATPPDADLRWWETAAAAGSSLSVCALIAAAVEPELSAKDAQELAEAYFPWIGCLHSLLDNLIDKREDEAAGHRSLLEYYPPHDAAARLADLTVRARVAAANMPKPAGHRVMLAAMIANYLSSPEARGPELRVARDAVIASAGPMIGASMAVFAVRRLGR